MHEKITLKHKIGQMILLGFKGVDVYPDDSIIKFIMNQQVGGVILFDYDLAEKTYDRNIKDPKQVKLLTQKLQNFAFAAVKNQQNSFIPLLIGIDYEGGKVNRLKEKYGFPKTISAAEIAQFSDEKAAEIFQQMARTLQEIGINLNFAPVLDLNLNPDNPIIGKIGRSFSAHPDIVKKYAAMFVAAHEAHGIHCVYKHFPGHGSSSGDTHLGFVDVTKIWQPYELEPYQSLFKTHPALVMTAHVTHQGLDQAGLPASLSAAITTELLRKKLNFQGVIVTDDLQMKAITDHYSLPETLRLAIHAGADILVFGNQLVSTPQDAEELVETIYADVMQGKINAQRIEESYQRILRLKTKIR